MFRKEFGNCGVFCLEFPDAPTRHVNIWYQTQEHSKYLAISAALKPAAVTTIVCGAPFFFEADHNLVEFPENFSKKLGRVSSVLGLSHEVVSRIAFAEAELAQATHPVQA